LREKKLIRNIIIKAGRILIPSINVIQHSYY
jgi:hypothetical protein